MAETVHVAIPSDEGYWRYAAVTAASAVRGSSMPVRIHIIDGGLSEDSWRLFCRVVGTECVRHRFDVSRFPEWHGSGITWSRLWLPELLDDLDWVVSADADIMFRGDIAALWAQRDGAIDILPSRDAPLPGRPCNENAVYWYEVNGLKFHKPDEYFCAGLSLLNLRRLRESDWATRRDEFLSRFDGKKMPNADQCVLNYLLQDNKYLLPRQWGAFSGDENADVDWRRPGAVHFVDDCPWKRHKITHLASDLVEEWWSVAKEIGIGTMPPTFHGCSNRLDWAWRRMMFLFLKHNQWVLQLHPKLKLHFRKTRGIR